MRVLFWLLLGMLSGKLMAKESLIIISPHRKSIQQEFVPAFEKYYKDKFKKDIRVEWIDQGGTSDDVRFIRAKFATNPKTIGIDLFWGGGSAVYTELAAEGFFSPYQLPKELAEQVPAEVANVPLYGENQTWYAQAMSSFGIFYNKKILAFDQLPEPKTWQDLANPVYRTNISLTDPRRSGSANTMNTIILQSLGWEKGWQLLTTISANARSYTHSSSDPIKAVVSGDAALALAIDFYALAKIGDLGAKNLGFALPVGETILDPDPIAILKGAPNRQAAEAFIQYVLGVEAQKRLVLPKGKPGGPEFSSLGRMAVNRLAYDQTNGQRINEFNPFAQKSSLKLDLVKATQMQRVFNDLVGAILIDTHQELSDAWARLVKAKKAEDPKVLAELSRVPVSEQEFYNLSKKWDDEVFRNETINQWVAFAKKKYQSLR